ncbi:MAG: thiamine phosphate synthase [Gammaproteobacteria bacterium]|nr:MAG: thiamine phosphate synthase [Gammaproteobacteria bacterium]
MSESIHTLRGLYAVTDATLQAPEQLTENVSRAIDGGAALVQYRDKSGNSGLRLRQASALADACRVRGVPLIINDDVELAGNCGAQGVHLGKDDTDPQAARRLLGTEAIIGVSCYNDLSLARQAAELGADYIAFGRFFASQTKPEAVQADADLIRQAKQELSLPVAAIGGITPGNAGQLIDAGADMLAVVHGIFAAADIQRAAADYAILFERSLAINKESLINLSLRARRGNL